MLDQSDPQVTQVLEAIEALCRAWMPNAYDAVVYCRDRFDQQAGGDHYRDKVLHLQAQVDDAVYDALTQTGVKLLDLPSGIDTTSRVRWIADRVTDLGLLIAS